MPQPLDASKIQPFLRKMPKTDLHLHLDGSLRTETLIELAKEQDVTLPVTDPDALRAIIEPGENCSSLAEYLQAFQITCSVMQTASALERIAEELVEDCAAEGIRYIEVRYSPVFLTEKKLSRTDAIEAVIRGLERGREKFGVESRQIICAMRHLPVALGVDLAREAASLRDFGVIAFDLAGAEATFPAADHEAAFREARRQRLRITVHAGEAAGPESIADAIAILGAERIGHGTALGHDPDLLKLVRDRQLPIEVCPTSNVQTGAVNSMKDHPALSYLRDGIPVIVCTDNRGVSSTTMTNEYHQLITHHDVSLSELRQLVEHSFQHAFLALPQRQKLKEAALRDFDALAVEHGLTDASA